MVLLRGLPTDSAFGTQLIIEEKERNAWRSELDKMAGRQGVSTTRVMALDDFVRNN